MTTSSVDARVFSGVPANEVDLWRSTLTASGASVVALPEKSGGSYTVIATPAQGFDHFPTVRELQSTRSALAASDAVMKR